MTTRHWTDDIRELRGETAGEADAMDRASWWLAALGVVGLIVAGWG